MMRDDSSRALFDVTQRINLEIQMRSEEPGRASWNVVKRDVIRESFIWWN